MMKKYTYTFMALCMLVSLQSQAQSNYSSTINQLAYQDLQNPTMIHGSDSIAMAYYVNCDMLFPVFGAHADFRLNASVPSLGAYVTRTGYLAVYEYPGFQHTDVFHGYYFPGLQKRDSASSISFELTGNAGNRLLKFQWKNMGLAGHTQDEFVNFQIGFDEATEAVTYHYGPSHIVWNSSEVAVISLFKAPNDFSSFVQATCLSGDASAPTSFTSSHPASFQELKGVIKFPPSGTAITFTSQNTGLRPQPAATTFDIFPLPFNHTLELSGQGDYNWELCDMTGRKILSGSAQNKIMVNTQALSEQLYWLKLEQNGNVQVSKVLKQ